MIACSFFGKFRVGVDFVAFAYDVLVDAPELFACEVDGSCMIPLFIVVILSVILFQRRNNHGHIFSREIYAGSFGWINYTETELDLLNIVDDEIYFTCQMGLLQNDN